MNKLLVIAIAYVLSIGIPSSPCGAATVVAPAAAGDDRSAAYSPGSVTRDWLRLQREGSSAGAAQPLPGAAATLLYQRYLNSFKNPIPAQFEDKRGVGSQ